MDDKPQELNTHTSSQTRASDFITSQIDDEIADFARDPYFADPKSLDPSDLPAVKTRQEPAPQPRSNSCKTKPMVEIIDCDSPHRPDQILATPGEVIVIDGRQGYSHLDLTCFDRDDASFEGNTINIDCGQGSPISIEYGNVSHAEFANGVRVELS